MKNSMNRRNYNNNRILNAKRDTFKITRQNIFVAAAMVAINFGVQVFSFLNNLITSGSHPYEGLTRGKLRQMWWLPCLVRY